MTWNGKEILTDFVYPPIPIRTMDWAAWIDGSEDLGMTVGRGASRDIAIADLIDQLA
jgi:hypothetical protein